MKCNADIHLFFEYRCIKSCKFPENGSKLNHPYYNQCNSAWKKRPLTQEHFEEWSPCHRKLVDQPVARGWSHELLWAPIFNIIISMIICYHPNIKTGLLSDTWNLEDRDEEPLKRRVATKVVTGCLVLICCFLTDGGGQCWPDGCPHWGHQVCEGVQVGRVTLYLRWAKPSEEPVLKTDVDM